MAGPLLDCGESWGSWADQEAKDLISSTAWLKAHGLKGSRLSLPQILGQIGFRHKEDYVPSLRKSISSQYAGGLFPQFVKDGAVYNLTASVQRLEELCTRLDLRAELYRRRLAWLTSGSRQLFGVIQERSISLVIDLGGTPWAQFYLGQDSACRVIREQVSRIAWFNLVRCAPSAQAWQEAAVCTSPSHIEDAVQWVRALQAAPSSPALVADALSKATRDPAVQAVYLFAVGDFGGKVSDLLRAAKNGQPIHCVSFNAKRKETIEALKELSQLTAGRFHAFVEITPIEDTAQGDHGSEGPPEGSLRPIGGMPPGAGVREDVFLVWREMEEARVTRAQIEDMLLTLRSPSPRQGPTASVCEDCMSSRDWLSRHGLKAQKLLLYDALVDCAFRHSDGVVDLKAKPGCGSAMADAESRCKLVNAKYCDRFAHMTWKDGSVVHVYVTAKKCRWYEDRMKHGLATLQKRLEWLQTGSREMFGTVLEEQVYFLIDTSESMKDRLSLVKSKIHELIQEQLCHKAKVNFVTLGSRVTSWRGKMEDVTEDSLDSAWHWVQGLQGGGSTHMLEALRLALADTDTQAVYLLTDSLPDQPAGSVLAHVQRDPLIPVHTISFCSDPAAERFLRELSEATGGRYNGYLPRTQDAGQQLPCVSEDVHLLKEEIEQGESDMEKVLKLRAKCVILDRYHSKDSKTAQKSCLGRPHSAPQLEGSARHAAGNQGGDRKLSRKATRQSTQATGDPACTAAALRGLLSRGDEQVLRDWMIPETLSLFQADIEKQDQVLHNVEKLQDLQQKSTIESWELCEICAHFSRAASIAETVSSLSSTPGEVEQKEQRGRRPQLCLDEPTAHWLRTNSLVARRLTMMDILAPAGISQKAKYVPVLDKSIYSKVFDEVLPFNGTIRGCRQLTLINPLAVDLEGYKTKLKEVLKMYERRLDLMVWRALTQEEKDKFASDKPLVFRENREALLQALERLGWPLTQEDVDLLEDQVCLGLSFLQQASDLQQAITQKMQEPRPGKGADDTLPAAPKETAVQVLDTLRGQRVIARSERDGFYYAGTVRRRVKGKQVMIDFIGGDCQIIPLRLLITVGGAGPCPPLAIGDFVFVGAGKQGAGDCFVPGVVIATPRRLEPIDKLYTVYKFDGKMVHAMRNKIIKVSQKRYTVTCCYIREQHQKEQSRTPEVDPVPQHSCGTTERLEPQRVRGTQANRAQGRVRRRQLRSFTNQARDAAVLGGRGHTAEMDNVGEEPLRMNTPSPPSSRPATLLLQPKSHHALQLPGGSVPLKSSITATETLALCLFQALGQQQGQKEKMQKCATALWEMQQALMKPLKDNPGQEEHLELLEELQKLLPPTSMGTKTGHSAGIPEYMTTVRLLLPKVSPGQEVLARWSHDGWYHRSLVLHMSDDQSFFLQNGAGMLERVWREDIITKAGDTSHDIKVEHPVISAHPLYPGRYCPATVLSITGDLQIKVRYYDDSEATVPRDQVYLVPAEKFEQDVAYALECEQRWVGEPVVARCENTGTYHPAEVQQQVGSGRQYLIRWADGTSTVQDREHIFGKWSPWRIFVVGDHVLALADPASHTFIPGVIRGLHGAFVHIQFINGESCYHAEAHRCFWLSEEQCAREHMCRPAAKAEEEDREEREEREEHPEHTAYPSESDTSTH